MNNSRRDFLKFATLASLSALSTTTFAGQLVPFGKHVDNPSTPTEDFWYHPRVLRLKRHQNNEVFDMAYWKDGKLDIENYNKLCWFLRDIRANKYVAIDQRVLDLLCAMQAWVSYYGFKKPFIISSGYRTKQTNMNLEGAAKNSMHLYGKAVDLITPDLPVDYMGKLAQHYSAGGVGFYPSNGFIHIDTGRIRTWGKRK